MIRMRTWRNRISLFGSVTAVVMAIVFLSVSGWAQTPFYQGKTITVIQGRDPGDAGDMRVKAVIPLMQKHIPGNPTIVSEYMPGGGGRKAANHLFRVAKPDGLTIGNIGAGFLANAVLGESGVQYDIDKFVYLGSPYSASHYVFLTRSALQLGSLEKLRATSGLRLGAQSVGHTIYIVGRLFAWLLGLKDPKFITAYGGNEIDAAILQGELDGRAQTADWLIHRNREVLEKRLIDLHAIFEIPKGDKYPDPHFRNLPEIESFAQSERERKLLAMQRGFRLAGSPFFLPPGVPKERVEIFQEAMRKAFKDLALAKEYRKLTGDDPTPLTPEANEKAVRDIPREPEIIALFKKLAGPDPLPGR
jgi:tripartite-type tricarboxylate transporter receptor subunit TctC